MDNDASYVVLRIKGGLCSFGLYEILIQYGEINLFQSLIQQIIHSRNIKAFNSFNIWAQWGRIDIYLSWIWPNNDEIWIIILERKKNYDTEIFLLNCPALEQN